MRIVFTQKWNINDTNQYRLLGAPIPCAEEEEAFRDMGENALLSLTELIENPDGDYNFRYMHAKLVSIHVGGRKQGTIEG